MFLAQMKTDTIELSIKEEYSKHQTKNIRFVMTRAIFYNPLDKKIYIDNTRWVIRDYKTGKGICSAKTQKKTRENFFKMLKSKKFNDFYKMRIEGSDIINTGLKERIAYETN